MTKNPTVNILIADDDEEDVELVEDAILSHEPQAELHKVSNGRAAIDFLNRRQDVQLPCLIILDYNMPEMTGSEVLVYMTRNERFLKIPKVILSTSSTPAHIQECLSHGATDYMVKPNNMADFSSLALKMLSLCRK